MPLTDSNLEGMFTFETGATPSPEDPPFHILVLGDWSGDAGRAESAKRRPRLIDRDNFGEVLQKLGTALELDLNGDGQTSISLKFGDIDDFHPDNLFRDVSIFAELREVRRNLKNADTFDEAAGRVRSWFNIGDEPRETEAADTGPPPSAEGLLDMIIGTKQESAAGQARKTDDSDLGRLISKVVSPYLVKVDENEQSKLVAAVDTAISDLMRSVLHHPRFQALEAAWRGLYFLVRRVETDVDLKIYILDLPKSECVDNLKSVSNLTDSILYRELIRETVETPGGEPWAAIGANYSFGLEVDDVAALMRIGKLAAGAGAPFISYLYPELYGRRSFAGEIDPTEFKAAEGTQAAKLWEALRGTPEANHLGFSPMRFLGRLPYGAQTDSTETFNFEEIGPDAAHEDFLWINPVFVCLLLLAQSYRQYGWDMGQALRHDLSGLPLYHYVLDGETKALPCGEVLMTESMSEKMLDNGLMPLISFRDTDRLRVGRIQSILHGGRKLAGRWN